VHYRCRMLVAADGCRSRIGRAVGITSESRRISTMFGYRLAAEHLPDPGYGQVILGGPTPILAYPISADEIRILFDMPHGTGRSPRPEDCADTFAALPGKLRREVEQAVATQPRIGAVAWASYPDRMTQNRVVLVGDAAGSCHPLTASGMSRCVGDALLLRDALAEHPEDWQRALQVYERRRCAPQATRVLLADALRETLCGLTPEARVMRRGILVYCAARSARRTATMALLSTADGRPLALKVTAHGFLAHLRAPATSDGRGVIATLRILRGLAACAAGYARQAFGGVPHAPLLRRADDEDGGDAQVRWRGGRRTVPRLGKVEAVPRRCRAGTWRRGGALVAGAAVDTRTWLESLKVYDNVHQ
jgi:Squalene epoxidase